MRENLLVRLPQLNDRILLRKLQREHFRRTGDGSFYALPPVVIIGKTEKSGFDRKKYNLRLEFGKNAIRTELGYLFPCNLEELQRKYSAYGESGLFFTKDVEPQAVDLPPLASFSLALLERCEDGYLLLQ
ncbi:MAG: hypothetical protein IJ831_12060 [Spirochaetales bacterium]|nr:hypothetical protein [Spirochaetales bacterium]